MAGSAAQVGTVLRLRVSLRLRPVLSVYPDQLALVPRILELEHS